MNVSVIVVTFNRVAMCEELLRTLKKQTMPAYEIIVLDDHSLEAFKPTTKHENVKIIRTDHELGLGRCRELGARLAQGEIVAFIDDDALVSENWVATINKAVTQGADIVGGLCKPLYSCTLPRWWDSKKLGKYLAIDNDFIVGCSFAIRKKVLTDLGYFKSYLGRIQGKKISNEEIEFILRASMAGYSVCFDDSILVYHRISASRLTIQYFIKRAWHQGISTYLTVGKNLKLVLFERSFKTNTSLQKAKKNYAALFLLLFLLMITFLGYLFGLSDMRLKSLKYRKDKT